MLANLLKFCPTGEEYTAFFSEAFTQTLPADLQILLDGSEDGVLKQFPQKADKLWAICCPADATMAVVTQQEEEDPDCLAAIQYNKKKEWGEKKQHSSNNSNNGSHGGDHGSKKPHKMFPVCFQVLSSATTRLPAASRETS